MGMKLSTKGAGIMVTVIVEFENGSTVQQVFKTVADAYKCCNENICYSMNGPTGIKRVTIDDRAVWDSSWDDVSKQAGLKMPT